MNKIDQALFDAWVRVGERCKRDPQEALRRFQRLKRASVSAPVRQWCLCLRSADTRIDSYGAIVQPMEDEALGPDTGTDDIVRQHRPHRVTLSGSFIRQLTEPIRIPYPGVPLWEAAAILGMARDSVRSWVRKGAVEVSRRDYCRNWGLRCKPIPIVYTPRPVDVHMQKGQPPDGVWGSLWQWKGESLPADFVMSARREARFKRWRGKIVFRGWDWLCPGRIASSGETIACGRRCQYLYAPLPMWTLAHSTGVEWALEMPQESGLKGAWHPGLAGELQQDIGGGRRTFACKHCWNVRNPSMLSHVGWNEFVTYISGGLLYGHEVERPANEAPYVRKHAWGKRRSRKPNAQTLKRRNAETPERRSCARA